MKAAVGVSCGVNSSIAALLLKQQVHDSEVAEIKLNYGPSMIRDENGLLAGYIYVDISDCDVGTYVKEAKRVVKDHVKLQEGYTLP